MSNFAWALSTVAVLLATCHGVRRGVVRLSMVKAIMLALLLCFILLPVISMNDDLLAVGQADLPLSGQTWRMAFENASVGLSLIFAAAYLLLLISFGVELHERGKNFWNVRPLAARLARSQRLRPPLRTA